MKIIPVPCSFDNYSYLLICQETGLGAVVDPTEAWPVMQEIEKHGVTLKAILCTHHHQDHIGDIGVLVDEFGDLEVVCHTSDQQRISSANSLADDGSHIRIGNLEGTVLHTPGHTSGSICYNFRNSLFTGDTLFGAGCGRLFEGTPEQMLQSLEKILSSCNDDTKVYFGHEYTRKNLEFAMEIEPGNGDIKARLNLLGTSEGLSTPSSLQVERRTNPFLRSAEESVKKGLELRGILGLEEKLDVFTQLRNLRNSY